MKYAVIRSGNKQYRVSEGDVLEVERLVTPTDSELVFSDVLLYVDGDNRKIGTPVVAGVLVRAKVLGDTKGKKIRVAKFLAKSRYRRVRGHRQALTKVQIQEITTGTSKKASESKEKQPVSIQKSSSRSRVSRKKN